MYESKHWKVDKSEERTTGSMKRRERPSRIQHNISTGDTAEGQGRDLSINQMTKQSKSKNNSLEKNKGRPAKLLGDIGEPVNGLNSKLKMDISRKDKIVATCDQNEMYLSKRRRTHSGNSFLDNVTKEDINVEKEDQCTKEAYNRSNRSEFVKQGVASVKGNGSTVIVSSNEMVNVERDAVVEEIGSKAIKYNNQDMEIAAVNTSVQVDMNDLNNKRTEMEKHGSTIEGNCTDSNDQTLPFVKTFPLWNQIQSMQVFQAIPQKPHFRMLISTCPENCREGMAIGYMVTFCSVVKKATELRLDNPRSSIVDLFDTLDKLEENGFDVNVIHDRLNSLLSKKDEYDFLLDQSKEFEKKIMEHNYERTNIVKEIDELDKQIKELLEKRDMALAMGETVGREIACFESNLKSVCGEIKNNHFDFIGATSRW